jgi:hypothetical protein
VKELRLRRISTVEAGNAFLPEFGDDFNRRFGREPQSARDAHRPLLEHESLDQTFTLQEQRKVSSNLTLHYNRVMYLLQPSELAEGARGKHVQVREYDNGVDGGEKARKSGAKRGSAPDSFTVLDPDRVHTGRGPGIRQLRGARPLRGGARR